MSNKQILLKIFKKYIEIHQWLEDKEYIVVDQYSNTKRLKDHLSKGIIDFTSPILEFSRGNDFIEMGSPSREDLEVYDVTTELNFTVSGIRENVKRFIQFLAIHNNDHKNELKFPKCFKDCYFSTHYLDTDYSPKLRNGYGHDIQSNWATLVNPKYKDNPIFADKEFIFEIPFKVSFKIESFDLKFNQPKRQIKNQRRI